jgi:hypothetical protein
MPSSEVDRLYQLPLAEFTAARNQLAKTSGDDGAAIKALEKPNIAAWAVNQLFWTKRKIYDALIAASEQVRAAHVKQLSGKSADVAAAEAAHHAAVKAAADESRRILAAAGDPATTATMSAVIETLQTLPTHDEPGKLTRPLKPLGFEALAGFVPGVRAPRPFPAPPRKETKPVDPKVSAREAAAHEKAAAKHRAGRILAFEKDARAAQKAVRDANDTLVEIKRGIASAEKEHARAEAQLAEIAAKLRRLRDELGPAERAAGDAAHELARLEHAIKDERR